MARLGSDVDQMEDLALVIEREANRMRSSAGEINSMMRDLAWWGPFHNFFLGWWDSKQYKWLIELADTLDGLGRTVSKQAGDQFQVSNSLATLQLSSSSRIVSGKYIGAGLELNPSMEATIKRYTGTNRADVSVYTGTEIGINVDDIHSVFTIAKLIAGGPLAVIASAVIPTVSGSIGVHLGTEYRWSGHSEANNIYGHVVSQTGTVANALGWVGHDDILNSFDNNDIPPQDSKIEWFSMDGEVAVGAGFGFTPNARAGLEVVARFGVEEFANSDTAYITQYAVGGSVEGGLGLTALTGVGTQLAVTELAKHLDVDLPGILEKVGGGIEWQGEKRFFVDDFGVPKTLIVSNTLTVYGSRGGGFPITNTDIVIDTVSYDYVFDLTDPNVSLALEDKGYSLALEDKGYESAIDLIFGVDSVAHLAEGTRYVSKGDTDQVTFGFPIIWSSKQAGSQYQVESAQIKPVGSTKFIDWQEG